MLRSKKLRATTLKLPNSTRDLALVHQDYIIYFKIRTDLKLSQICQITRIERKTTAFMEKTATLVESVALVVEA